MIYADIYVHNLSEIPSKEHWAIVSVDHIVIPGDERSRTNPGHGYPEHRETRILYEVYFTEEKFKQAFLHQSSTVFGKKIKGIHVSETYTTTSQIIVERNK